MLGGPYNGGRASPGSCDMIQRAVRLQQQQQQRRLFVLKAEVAVFS